ncbi:hypothetical protein [Azotobacter armeniacus]
MLIDRMRVTAMLYTQEALAETEMAKPEAPPSTRSYTVSASLYQSTAVAGSLLDEVKAILSIYTKLIRYCSP